MSHSLSTTVRVQSLLAELHKGDNKAEDRLMQVVQERFRILAHHMLNRYQRIRHLEDTDDVLQRTWLRLHTALKSFRPESPHVFFALASKHMRWVLIDLAQSYGRENRERINAELELMTSPPRQDSEPLTLEHWAQFHAAVEQLPEEERTVVSLLYYQGLTQEAASDLIGIAVRTVKLRWQTAKLNISRFVKEQDS
jgi:RNA polymerase sigma factor (sigma-70 family)